MVVAVYGGAFNPPHVGHAMVASWILWTGRADKVLLVPSAEHPFGKDMAPFDLRFEMCCAIAQHLGVSVVSVTSIEKRLPPPNYTLNLLRALQARRPEDKYRCVMGVDNLIQRDKWFGFDAIEAEFSPIYVDRAGVEHSLTLDSPKFPDISSTEVRRRLAENLPVDHLVPAKVLQALCGTTPTG